MRKLISVSLLVLAISCSVYAGEVPMDGRTGEIPNDDIASTPPSRTMAVEEKQQAENNIMDVTIVILKNVLLLF